MSTLQDELRQLLGGSTMEKLSTTLGTDRSRAEAAVDGALPVLLGAMRRNVERPGGADALDRALGKDHDGSVLDRVDDVVTNPPTAQGQAILEHILGGRTDAAQAGLSQFAGMDKGQIMKLLIMLAPLLLGVLGKKKQQGEVSGGGLPDILGREEQEARRRGGGGLDDLLGTVLGGGGGGRGGGAGAGCLGSLLGGLLKGRGR